MDQPRVAISFFERCGEWARELERAGGGANAADEELVKTARQQLVHAYERHAGEHERDGEWGQAMAFYDKAIAAAREMHDAEAEMNSLYHLALIAHAQHSTPSTSITHLQAALALARQLSSPLECPILLQLALTYQASSELNLAVSYLEEAYMCAVRQRDDHLQGDAMGRLGEVYSLQGEHREAMRMFEKCYELAKRNGERRLMEVARINVGQSRANVFMQQFIALMEGEEEMRVLMTWKTRRQGLKIGG